jgi:hypothetical protein
MAKYKRIGNREGFINRAQEVHGDCYDYSFVEFPDRGYGKTHQGKMTRKLSNYDGNKKVKILCQKHGEFYQVCRKHLEGHGCKRCAAEVAANALRGRSREGRAIPRRYYLDFSLPEDLKVSIRKSLSDRKAKEAKCVTRKFIIDSPTHGKIEVLIDESDWLAVSQHKWSVSKRGNLGRDGKTSFYITTRIPLPNEPRTTYTSPKTGKTRTYMACRVELLHRFIANPPDGFIVDHINANPLDNRRFNLRVCTYKENAANSAGIRFRGKNKTSSRYKGVSATKEVKSVNMWKAYFRCSAGHYNLGSFFTEEDAARAYDIAAILENGEFAYVNFPIEDYL